MTIEFLIGLFIELPIELPLRCLAYWIAIEFSSDSLESRKIRRNLSSDLVCHGLKLPKFCLNCNIDQPNYMKISQHVHTQMMQRN